MPRPPQARHRVVVTGLGCVTPLGADVASTFDAATLGRSGVGAITRFDVSDYPVRIAAQTPDEFDAGDVPPKQARRLDRFVRLATAAAHQALRDGGFEPRGAAADRVGVAIGSGIGGIETLHHAIEKMVATGPRRVSPFTIPMLISNMASGFVAIRYGLRGPNLCQAGACATGAHSIGEAARWIERGDADAVIAGGSEAPVAPLAMAGFAAMRALSPRNDDPTGASRPFDLDREGFVIGEGAGVLLLESMDHARARGARIRAEVLGYGASADAADVAQPAENGEGAARCIALALADAGLVPEDVDYVNAHATGTPAGDIAEAVAIRSVFGSHTDRLAVSSTKSMTGHLLGAAGAVEALLCVRSLETGLLPPTINLDRPDPACALDHVANKARPAVARIALSNSFGFGGTNAALVLGRAED